MEDSLYRLCSAYRFTQANVWVVPSNIQATVTDPDGAVHTQVRHVRQGGVDFDVLDRRLNDASRSRWRASRSCSASWRSRR